MAHDAISTLLPAAQVHFYARDPGTLKTANDLSADWRCARVQISAVDADMDAAIAHYRDHASPEIVVIETDDISDAFIAKLSDLAAVCASGTEAVIIGPKNDVHLYRSLIDLGVRDYLVRPLAEDDIYKVIAKVLIEKNGLSGSTLISVIAAKGGMGATSVAQNAAVLIADMLKQKTTLVDLGGSSGTINIAFGLEPSVTLAEAVRIGQSGSEDDIKRLQQSAGDNLSVVTLGGDPILADAPPAESIEVLLNRLMQKNPVVVVDLSDTLPSVRRQVLAKSNHVILVTTAALPALRNSRSLITEIKRLRGGLDHFSAILSMKGAHPEEARSGDLKSALDVEPEAILPYTTKLFAAAEIAGVPAARTAAGRDYFNDILPILAKACGVSMSKDGGQAQKGGFLSAIKNMGKK